jgi:hypothetical protein
MENEEVKVLNKIGRIVLSIAGGTSIVLLFVLLIPFLAYRNIGMWLGATLLYWPLDVISSLGIGPDCANANLVAEKLNCIALSFGVDVVFYSALVFLGLTLTHRRTKLR